MPGKQHKDALSSRASSMGCGDVMHSRFGLSASGEPEFWAIFLGFFFYLMNCTTFIGVQQSSQPNFTALPSQTLSASPHPQPVSFGNHKFFKICESVFVLQRSSLCPF